jgi:putative tRNA adenosine deaminase-associated protein
MATQKVQAEDIDYSVILWREEGQWNGTKVPARQALVLDDLLTLCKQYPGEGGVFAAIGVAEEFFILLRHDPRTTEAIISDSVALLDWDLAVDAADLIELDWEEDDLEEFEAIGDLDMLHHFGVRKDDVLMICENPDLYPDLQVAEVFQRIGASAQWKKLTSK